MNPFPSETGSRQPPVNGAQARDDVVSVDDLKGRFRRDELALDDYLQGLVALRTGRLEEELLTDAAIHAKEAPTHAKEMPPPQPSLPVEPARHEVEPPPAVRATRSPPPSILPRLLPANGVLGGRFELEECVGRGGTGDVYRARDLLADQYDRDHSTVAVKLLHPHVTGNLELLRQVLRSAATMRRITHPNIVRVFDVQHLDGRYLVIEEWLDGISLASRLDAVPRVAVSREEVTRIAGAVGAALGHIHAQGAVHGDVKPGNVYLAADGRILLLDFGFRRVRTESQPQAMAPYTSCEALEGQPLHPQDDIYSLASMLYRLLAGDWAYGKLTALEAEAARVKPGRPPGLTRRQWDALRAGLAFRRPGRPASVSELVAPFAVPAKPAARRHLLPAALLGLLALIGVQVWEGWRPSLPAMLLPEEPAAAPLTGPVTPASPPMPIPAVRPVDVAPTPAPVVVEPEITPPPAAPASVATTPPTPAGPTRIRLVPEGQWVVSESDPSVRLKLQASSPPRRPVTLVIRTGNGEARAGEDYLPPEETLTLGRGQRSAEISIPLVNDAVAEHVEDFNVGVSVLEGDAEMTAENVMIVIQDDD